MESFYRYSDHMVFFKFCDQLLFILMNYIWFNYVYLALFVLMIKFSMFLRRYIISSS